MVSRTTETVPPGLSASPAIATLAPGSVIAARYEVRGLLGLGGSGLVYAVLDRELRADVALKILRPDRMSQAALKRFRREVQVARQAESPHLVRVFDIGQADGALYLTMELVDGKPLRSKLGGRIPPAEAVRIGVQILEGLSALHSEGIVHRDVKPGNVILTDAGDVKLADFGLALRLESEESRLTHADSVLGTIEYLSPEQALGKEVDARSDLYSFGVVLFEMLTGRLPWREESSLGTAIARFRESPPDVRKLAPEVPVWLAAVVVSGSPAVCLTPSSLGFSDQTAGTTSPAQTVTLRNCGTGSLRVTAITASLDFAIAAGGVTLPLDLIATGATTFQVVFAPQSGGSKSGRVQIFSNAPGSPSSLALSGNAIPAPVTDGTIQVTATLNGDPYSGTVLFSLTQTPGGSINGGSVPYLFTSRPAATYTVAFLAAPPGGGSLTSITPSATQTLQAGGSLIFTLNFTAPNEFSFLALSPSTKSVSVGGSTTYSIQAGVVTGGSQQLALSVSGLPVGASASFSPQPLVITGSTISSTLTMSTSSQTPPGIYSLTITCTNQNSVSHSQAAILVVVTPQQISLASVSSGGAQGNGPSSKPAISPDGRFVAFVSTASNLTADPFLGYQQVFLRDRQTGQTTLVSVSDSGSPSALGSYWPSVSADGRYVAFNSDAGNLAPGAVLGRSAVYVRDISRGRTQLISAAPDGTPANNASCCASMSADGRFVAFGSPATNLVAGTTNGQYHIFVRDLQTGTTEIVSIAGDGTQANSGASPQAQSSISADGRVVAFISTATNLTADATNGVQVFARDRASGQTTMASKALSGAPSGSVSPVAPPAVSADGRFIAFQSYATNLVPGDMNPGAFGRIFIHDRLTNFTRKARTFISANPADDPGGYTPSVSSDGRLVVFRAVWQNGPPAQLVLWDAQTDRTVALSVATDGSLGGFTPSDQNSVPVISPDGRAVVFSSTSSTLVANDSNGVEDVFVVGNSATAGVYVKSLSLSSSKVIGGSVV